MGNGMKSGSGEDPFEGIESATEDNDPTGDHDDTTAQSDPIINDDPTDEDANNSGNSGVSGLPWKYSRSNAKDGREMVQFFLQEETQTAEEVAQSELESRLDENVLALDLREAAYQVALEEHLDDVADRLREWGYDAE
ncbi:MULTISPECIES: hypothetical protein [Haloarcula]|uniref:Uncharacterized protein n=3 Tax=Haloarcula TaxID=2237 RepID=A0A830EWP4_9EURY|nr:MULTISPECIES: hypothetical protein [Haloarcula]GGK82756.1 hypothetical protein GCM10009067_38730 [Haloarcula sebkhae]GGM51775.1 hypothetical protein GCM10009006_36190 [Haloarcula argentinensis]